MRKFALWITTLKLTAFILLELVFRTGLWMRWLDNDLPPFIADSGFGTLIVFIYVLWLLVEPVVNGLALITKDRGFLLEHKN